MQNENAMVSLSGGADSDIMLDMLLRFARLHNLVCKILSEYVNKSEKVTKSP